MFRERKRTQVSCEVCGAITTASSLRNHMERKHGKILTQTCGMGVRVGRAENCVVSFPCVLTSVACPVEGCPTKAHNPGRLREHFMYRHCKANIAIIQ